MTNQIELCKKCIHKSFSSSQGIVCGLTSEKPTFVNNCPSFEKDVAMEKKLADRRAVEEDVIYDENDKPVSPWRIVLSVLIFILVIIRLVVRCNNH
ncbi:hypothetical protein [Kordia zhangzhouensis]|uniref:hypothetical protein n=1 Tax=Kordia zhangzhouensis TaxID=1620405 RepID=UPI0006291146|nr:hypothetical protein [Kordia zhangzhouensis]